MKIANLDILDSIKNSNIAVFDAFFKETYKKYCQFAYKYISDKDICQDIVQEVFIKLWEKRESLNIKESLSTYLYSSVKNRCIDHIRIQTKRSFESEWAKIEEIRCLQIDSDNFDEEVLDKYFKEAVSKLPERCKLIFTLNRFENKTNDEIALQLEITKKTVENQIVIATEKIRNYLIENKILTAIIIALLIEK